MLSLLEDNKRNTLTPSLLDLDKTNFNTSGIFTLKMMRVLTSLRTLHQWTNELPNLRKLKC